MQIHCSTDTFLIDYSSTFTNVFIWDFKKESFCSVTSFAMIVLGPLKIYKKLMLQWHD